MKRNGKKLTDFRFVRIPRGERIFELQRKEKEKENIYLFKENKLYTAPKSPQVFVIADESLKYDK